MNVLRRWLARLSARRSGFLVTCRGNGFEWPLPDNSDVIRGFIIRVYVAGENEQQARVSALLRVRQVCLDTENEILAAPEVRIEVTEVDRYDGRSPYAAGHGGFVFYKHDE